MDSREKQMKKKYREKSARNSTWMGLFFICFELYIVIKPDNILFQNMVTNWISKVKRIMSRYWFSLKCVYIYM